MLATFGEICLSEMAMRRETRRIRTASLAGVTLINQYMVISFLGQGSSGRVYLCLVRALLVLKLKTVTTVAQLRSVVVFTLQSIDTLKGPN